MKKKIKIKNNDIIENRSIIEEKKTKIIIKENPVISYKVEFKYNEALDEKNYIIEKNNNCINNPLKVNNGNIIINIDILKQKNYTELDINLFNNINNIGEENCLYLSISYYLYNNENIDNTIRSLV